MLLYFGTQAYLFSPDEASFYIFSTETIAASFLHLMVLLFKVLFNHVNETLTQMMSSRNVRNTQSPCGLQPTQSIITFRANAYFTSQTYYYFWRQLILTEFVKSFTQFAICLLPTTFLITLFLRKCIAYFKNTKVK